MKLEILIIFENVAFITLSIVLFTEANPVDHVTNLAALLCADLAADPTANEKKMSLAIYLKQFFGKLIE